METIRMALAYMLRRLELVFSSAGMHVSYKGILSEKFGTQIICDFEVWIHHYGE